MEPEIKDSVYARPDYYEIAFSFRDSAHEVDVLETLAQTLSPGPVRRMLEIGCGPAPHLEEILRRGYDYIGLDLSEVMIQAVRDKAARLDGHVEAVRGDLRGFELAEPADFAFVLLGSLYVASTEELNAHFDAMARALRPGALYVLDWCIDFTPAMDMADTWEEERDGIHVAVEYMALSVDRVEQIYREQLTLDVTENGETARFVETMTKRALYPQEFLLYMQNRPDFEFAGWWNNWDLDDPLENTNSVYRPVIAVRRV
jgi:SAM-dependent methyltransferase